MTAHDNSQGRWPRTLGLSALVLVLVAGTSPNFRSEQLTHAVEMPVYRLPENRPLMQGRYDYALRWSGLPVARVSIDMQPSPDSRAVNLAIVGATHPVIDLFWRYRFDGRGRVATAPFAPERFEVQECERSRLRTTAISFSETSNRVQAIRRTGERHREYWFESDNTFDIPSSVYLLLNLDYELGATYQLDTFTGKSRYLVNLEVEARETIRVGDTDHDAWRIGVRTQELTDDDDGNRHRNTQVWVSPDRPGTLLRATSDTFVGAITLELDAHATPGALRPSRCGTQASRFAGGLGES